MSRGRGRDEILDEGWSALEHGDVEAALEAAEDLLHGDERDAEAHHLAGSALFEAEDLEGAEPHFRRAIAADEGLVEARSALAELLFETCRFDEAIEQVGLLLDAEPDDAAGHYLASLLAERRGDLSLAATEERLANRLAPDAYPLPGRLTRAEFDGVVQKAVAGLPSRFRDRMQNLAILVEDVPSDGVLRTLEDPSPGLLGLFVGTPLPEKRFGDVPTAPDAIYLFKRNLERMCDSREELIEEIHVTLLHEVGHFMGLDEEQIEKAGFE